MKKESNKLNLNQLKKSLFLSLTLILSTFSFAQDALKVEKFVLDNGFTVILTKTLMLQMCMEQLSLKLEVKMTQQMQQVWRIT